MRSGDSGAFGDHEFRGGGALGVWSAFVRSCVRAFVVAFGCARVRSRRRVREHVVVT